MLQVSPPFGSHIFLHWFECQALLSPTSAVDTETTREPSETAAASTPSTSPVDVDFTFAMGSMQLQPLELFPETQMYGDSFAFNPVPAHVPVQALHGQDGVGSGIETSYMQATIVLVSFHRPVCRLLASRPFGKTSIREIRNGFQMMLCSNAYRINLRLPFALNLNKARSWTFAAMMNLPCPLHRFL